MGMELYGYPTRGQRITGLDTTGRKVDFRPAGTSAWLLIRNAGTTPLRVFFSQEDFDAGDNYLTLGVTDEVERRFEGPYRHNAIWFKAAAASTDIELVHFRERS